MVQHINVFLRNHLWDVRPHPFESTMQDSFQPTASEIRWPADTLFWDTIFSMNITSAECLPNISTLVHSPSKISEARSLQGDQAQSLIDLIDQVCDSGRRPSVPRVSTDRKTQLLTPLHLEQKLFRRCSRLLYKVCKTNRMLPASCTIPPELICVGEHERSGGFADVNKGEYQGRHVAIKQLRIETKDGFDKIFKVREHTHPATSRSFTFHPAPLSGSSHLETLVSPKHAASVGSFRVSEPPIFTHHL